MRFSLTGDQAEAALLVQSIVQSPDHSLDVIQLRGDLETRLMSVNLPDCRRVASAEEVLIAGAVDTVIVAESWAEQSIVLARQASQADCHVVVIPPREVSTAWSYELHLLLDESRYGIVVLTGRWYLPEPAEVDQRGSDWQLGLPSPHDDPDAAATLMHAVDSCSALGFANSQITVLGGDPAADGESAGVSRQVVLSGTSAEGAARPSVTIHCSRSADPYVLRGRSASETFEYPVIIPGHVETVPEVLVSAVCGRLTETLPSPAACQRGMDQLSRTLQVLEAVPKSIRRRRTIDVYADELTERSVFKTQMTAMGCGVLTWLLLGMIGYLLVGQLFKPPHSLMQILRALWIAPLVMFLLAQLLLPLARGRQSVSSSDTERTTQDNAQDSAADSG